MVAHHDDIVTRMKNVEMIEIGKYRIKPWYFSPYPQVRKCRRCSLLKSHYNLNVNGSSICYIVI